MIVKDKPRPRLLIFGNTIMRSYCNERGPSSHRRIFLIQAVWLFTNEAVLWIHIANRIAETAAPALQLTENGGSSACVFAWWKISPFVLSNRSR